MDDTLMDALGDLVTDAASALTARRDRVAA
jgi:hypothetical protein